MNQVKRILSIVWITLGLYAGYFSITSVGVPKFLSGLGGNTSDLVFGMIMLFILTPLITGALFMFGYYAYKGEYEVK